MKLPQLDNLPFFRSEAKGNIPRRTESSFFLIRGLDGTTFSFRTLQLSELILNYRQIAPLNTAIDKIADAVGGLPCALKDKKSGQIITEHPFLDLIRHPNAEVQKTKRALLRDMAIWKILTGNTYPLATGPVNRPPLELFVLASHFVTPIGGKNGFIDSYRYNNSFRNQVYTRDDKDRFIEQDGLGEIYDIMNFNPDFDNSRLRGLSGIESLFFELNQYLFTSRHNLSLLANGARPSGAFVLKSKKDGFNTMLSDEAYERLKNEIQTSYIGAQNAGRPLILEGGMEWQQISLSGTDMDFKSLQDEAEKQIYKNLEIPIELVMAVGTTFSNMDLVRVAFYENTVLPFADDLFLHLERFLLPRYPDGKKFHFVVNEDLVTALEPVKVKKRERLENSIVLTVNEKRKKLGLEPIDGGDKITDPNGRPIAGKDAVEVVAP